MRTWAMRGTMHILSAEDVPWLVPLTAEPQLSGAYRRLAQLGVPRQSAGDVPGAIERILGRSGPLTRPELAERLAGAGFRTEGQAAFHLIRLAGLRGLVCFGAPRDGEETFVLTEEWLGARPALPDRASGLAELAARYLGAHGPATERDFATWSGLRVTEAKAAFRAIGDRLLEVRVAGATLWTVRSRELEAPRGVVRLVPAFDPYLLGWASRELVLPKEHERAVFPGGGMLRPAVVADGVVRGTWSIERRRDRAEVSVAPFADLPSRTRRAVADEAQDVARFQGLPSEGADLLWLDRSAP